MRDKVLKNGSMYHYYIDKSEAQAVEDEAKKQSVAASQIIRKLIREHLMTGVVNEKK